ncbi:hypothetical protein LZC95_04150 [Pendulispora brunnea]|uniref:Tetratricopeptide repeat protein n=1 Tax=Pendulispora brunnea TaxID=2905690 RepID=A0ABZ2KBI4_9BACT
MHTLSKEGTGHRRRRILPWLMGSHWTRKYLAVLAVALVAGGAAAQPAAQRDLLGRGRQLFEDQRYEESIQTLSAALLRPNNPDADKIEIYRVLALDFITLNKKEEAESALRGLLALRPDYEFPSSESPRFRDFFTAIRDRWVAEGRPGLVKTSMPQAQVLMAHISPAEWPPDRKVTLSVRLSDPQHRVTGVQLLYRTGSRGPFNTVEATMENDLARATIPATAMRPPLVEYYIEGLDSGGLPIVSRGDASAPLRMAVPEPRARHDWVLPAAIGGAVLGAAVIVGGLALTGVFSGGNDARTSTVSVTVR